MKFNLAIILSTIFLVSCGDKDSSSVDLAEIKNHILENQNKWNSSGLVDYSFTYQRSPGDCPQASELPAIDIYVEDGAVASVYYSGTNEVANMENAVTINDIFSYQLALVDTPPIQFSNTNGSNELPTFDSDLGYPVSFFVDKSKNECDAIFNRISNFQ